MRLQRGTGSAAAVNISIAGVSAVSGLLVARWLGPADRGVLALLLAWFTVALPLGELGISVGITVASARLPHQGRTLFRAAAGLFLGLGVVTALLVCLLAWLFQRNSITFTLIVPLALLIPIGMLSGLPSFILQATNRNRWNATRSVQPISYLILICIAWGSHQFSLIAALTCYIASLLIALAIGYVLLRTLTSPLVPAPGLNDEESEGPSSIRALRRMILGFGLRNFPSTIPSSIASRIDVLILGSFVAIGVVGQYSVSLTLIGLSQPAVMAVAALTLPAAAALGTAPTSTALRALAFRSLRDSVVVSTALSALIAIAAPILVSVLLGDLYSSTPTLVRILCVAQPGIALALVFRSLLQGTNRPGAAAIPEWASLTILVALLVALIPALGAVGACLSVVLSAWFAAALYGMRWRHLVPFGSVTGLGWPTRRQHRGPRQPPRY